MIQLPQRSVTRFFIPLIDVLTLLFCIFLVLPLAQKANDASADAVEAQLPPQTEEEVERLRQSAVALRDEIERLKRDKGKELQKRLAVRVLEIDDQTGKLYYRDPERLPIPNEATARALVERDRQKLGQKELYYLLLYPRDPASSYPTVGQRADYDRWFEGVALGYDNPNSAGEGARP
jgi:cell division protein FtsB